MLKHKIPRDYNVLEVRRLMVVPSLHIVRFKKNTE
jgi:hypothetical protein